MVVLALAVAGCHLDRGPNIASVSGVWVGHSRTPLDAGTTGGVATKISAVRVFDDPFVASTAGTIAVGGNADGLAGQFDLASEFGWAPKLDGPHHLFLRGGFAGTVEADPYTSFFAFEFPTLTAGYVFHGTGDGPVEATHFEIGAHAALVDASRARIDGALMDRVAAVSLGPVVDFRTFAFASRVEYDALFNGRLVHALRTSSCAGIGFVACVDTRHMTFPDLEKGFYGYVGVSFGVGWVAGLVPR